MKPCILFLFIAVAAVCVAAARDLNANHGNTRTRRRRQRQNQNRTTEFHEQGPVSISISHVEGISADETASRYYEASHGDARHTQSHRNSSIDRTERDRLAEMMEARGRAYTTLAPISNPSVLTKNHYINRLRMMHLRMFSIQMAVLQGLEIYPKPNMSQIPPSQVNRITEIYRNRVQQHSENTHDSPPSGTKKFQAAVPSCDLPRNADQEWLDPQHFRLYFNIGTLSNYPGYDNKVMSSILRLYMKSTHSSDCSCATYPTTSLPPPNNTSEPQTDDDEDNMTNSAEDEIVEDFAPFARPTAAPEVKNPSTASPKILRIKVYQFNRPVRANKRVKRREVFALEVNEDHVGWVFLNLTSTTNLWYKRPSRNLGLEVVVLNEAGQSVNPFHILRGFNCSELRNQTIMPPVPLSIPDDNSLNFNETVMYDGNSTYPNLDMLISQTESRSSRSKRQAPTCVLEKIDISLEDYDWIIQPKSIEAAYCTGTCLPIAGKPHGVHTSSRQYQKQCCGPTQHRPLSFLHYDNNFLLTYSVWENFIVTACGCV